MSKIKLNEQQQEAVDHFIGPCSVVANPGSGKSEILIRRIYKLVKEHDIPESDILAITFTRNAADNMVKRLSKLDLHFVNVGTFHSICGKILRKEGIDIGSNNMIQEWQIDNCFKEIDKHADTEDIISFISYQKNYMRGVNDKFVKKFSNYDEKELRE